MGIAERRQREKEQRRKAIVDAAERVFFTKGMETATMDEVAEEAELSKGTLYLYFKSKEDLYLAITKRGLNILIAMFKKALSKESRGIDKVFAIGRAYQQFARNYPDYFRAQAYFNIQANNAGHTGRNAKACEDQGDIVLSLCAEAIRCGIEDKTIRKDLIPEKASIILWGQTMGVLQLVLSKKKNILQTNISL